MSPEAQLGSELSREERTKEALRLTRSFMNVFADLFEKERDERSGRAKVQRDETSISTGFDFRESTHRVYISLIPRRGDPIVEERCVVSTYHDIHKIISGGEIKHEVFWRERSRDRRNVNTQTAVENTENLISQLFA